MITRGRFGPGAWKVLRRAGVPFAVLAVVFVMVLVVASAYPEMEGTPVWANALFGVLLLVGVVAVLFVPVRLWQLLRYALYAAGRLPREVRSAVERDEPDMVEGDAAGWANGQRLIRQIETGETLQENLVWNGVGRFGERVRFDLWAERFSVGKAGSWTDRPGARIAFTDERLLCKVGRRWESYPFRALTEMRADLGAKTVVLRFSRKREIAVGGSVVPLLAVYATWRRHGAGAVRREPALAELASAVPPPRVPLRPDTA
ncbi:hypothetical protein [Actinocorallia aurantiaca]|uniref:Uncharacterized protein n=1 Tax=Actinocorallia aurantiaca TaxID=46204 RepID=A0ABN3UG31_9ACTN